jgi:eukaryotic-like serine/threonine-protein kinase
MIKSRKLRSLFAAVCATGSACASGPKVIPPPPPEECPPGAQEAMKRVDIYNTASGVLFAPVKVPIPSFVPVRQGPVTANGLGPWGALPDRTVFSGKLFFGTNRVYGRFTEARLPNGEVVPVCLEMYRNGALGVPMVKGSTPEQAIIGSSVTVASVYHFGEDN